ncbi:hypothetical protein QYF36_006526 [Acer negundo]|nr:hypothetical protein QYF36_010812 [Acer negundo]KAK4857804.1 hypothetical protein QYF36_006526 [Acer negundo]
MHRLCFLLLRRMGDVFMFAAQPENVTTDDGKEQPPDFTNIAKRARSQEAEERHSKECCKEGIVEQEMEDKQNKNVNRGDSNESNPYGPRMQISY